MTCIPSWEQKVKEIISYPGYRESCIPSFRVELSGAVDVDVVVDDAIDEHAGGVHVDRPVLDAAEVGGKLTIANEKNQHRYR